MKRLTALWWREILALHLWFLPLVLLPYLVGVWWVFRSGYGLVWMAVVAAGVLGVWGCGFLLRRRASSPSAAEEDVDASAAERRAREAIAALAREEGDTDLSDPVAAQALIATLWRNVTAAWYRKERPEFRFTLPEALYLVERTTRRFRLILREELPATEYVEISDALFLNNRILPATRSAGRIFRVGKWIFRGAAPQALLLQELTRVVFHRGFEVVKGSARRRVTTLLIQEAGESLILLYSRRLRGELLPPAAEDSLPEHPPAEARLRILIAGQTNAGKSSLINALTGSLQAVADPLPRGDGPRAVALEGEAAENLVLVELPGTAKRLETAWTREVRNADAVVWVVDAHRADRRLDQEALHRFRSLYDRQPDRRPPALLLVLTHVDRLEPAREWTPPYDPEGNRPKERSMREAREVISAELGVRATRVALTSCDATGEVWNLEEVWMKLVRQLPEAAKTRLERLGRKRSVASGLQATAASLPGILNAGSKLASRDPERGPREPPEATEGGRS